MSLQHLVQLCNITGVKLSAAPKTLTESLNQLIALGQLDVDWKALCACFAVGRHAFGTCVPKQLGFCGKGNSQFLKRPNAIGLQLSEKHGEKKPACYTCIGDELTEFGIPSCHLAGTPAGTGNADHCQVDPKHRGALALLILALMSDEYPYAPEIAARWLLIAIVSCGSGATGPESVAMAVTDCPELEAQLQLLPAYEVHTKRLALEAKNKHADLQAEALAAEAESVRQQAEELAAKVENTDRLEGVLKDQIGAALAAEAAALKTTEQLHQFAFTQHTVSGPMVMYATPMYAPPMGACPYPPPMGACLFCGAMKALQYDCPRGCH